MHNFYYLHSCFITLTNFSFDAIDCVIWMWTVCLASSKALRLKNLQKSPRTQINVRFIAKESKKTKYVELMWRYGQKTWSNQDKTDNKLRRKKKLVKYSVCVCVWGSDRSIGLFKRPAKINKSGFFFSLSLSVNLIRFYIKTLYLWSTAN